MRGRKPDARAGDLALIRNNPGRRPQKFDVPRPPLSMRPPPELAADRVAREVWRTSIRPGIVAGQFVQTDRVLVTAFCLMTSVWRSQIAAASVGPATVPGVRPGTSRGNPLQVAANQSLQLIIALARECGLSPSARRGIRVEAPRPSTPLDRFLKKGDAPA